MTKTLVNLITGLLVAVVAASSMAQSSSGLTPAQIQQQALDNARAQTSRTLTPEQQKAHSDAKTVSGNAADRKKGGFLSTITDKESSLANLPPEANSPQSEDAEAQLKFLLCAEEITNGVVKGQQLSDDCRPIITGQIGAGKTENDTAYWAAQIEDLCVMVLNPPKPVLPPDGIIDFTGKPADPVLDLTTAVPFFKNTKPAPPKPKTQLETHCSNLLSAKKMVVDNYKAREAVLAGLQLPSDAVSAGDKGKSDAYHDDIKANYTDCKSEQRLVARATTAEETCSNERTPSLNNMCAKTLTANVTWQCPAGTVLSGPTRVTAGTDQAAGRYTCQMQVPRDVYSCPAGSTGPTNLVVPPGTQREQACTRTADGTVLAATRTVVQDTVTRDATYTVADQWSSGCASMEANTPVSWRSPPGVVGGPMAAFDSSPNTARCQMKASVCGDPATTARVINDVPVSRACWQYSESFDCISTNVADTCAASGEVGCATNKDTGEQLCDKAPTCTTISDSCTEWDNELTPPTCIRHEYRRSCEVKPPVYTETTGCEKQTFCPGGTCWDTGYKANEEFGESMSLFSVAQQGGRYFNANNFRLFEGFPAACAHRDALALNCCKKNFLGGLIYWTQHILESYRPSEFLGGRGSDVTGRKADGTDENGKSMYSSSSENDTLFISDAKRQASAAMRSVDSMKGAASEEWKAIKDQDYGKAAWKFFVTGPMKVAGTLLDLTLDLIVELNTLFGLYEGCYPSDSLTRLKKKRGLCIDVGSHCTKKAPLVGWCMEREYRSCCFNSVLAKLINDQGRKQLMDKKVRGTLRPADLTNSLFSASASSEGERFGTGESPNCKGLSLDQLKQVDLSKMDWSEFIATLDPKLLNKAGDVSKPGDDLMAQVRRTFDSCVGGSAQCAGDAPQSADANNDIGVAVDSNFDESGENIIKTPVAKQETSLKRLMMKAYNLPYGEKLSSPINSEDIRLLSKWRFHKGEPPVTATVSPLSPHSVLPNCKLMTIELLRAEVTQYWDDKLVPVVDENGSITMFRPPKPGEQTSKGSRVYPAKAMRSGVVFCGDGKVVGASL